MINVPYNYGTNTSCSLEEKYLEQNQIRSDQIRVKSSFHSEFYITCGSFTCGAHMYDVPRRYYYYLLLFTIYALPVQHGAVLTYALSFDPRVTFVALAVSAVVMFRKCTVESVLNYRRYM